jgi:hypothetical protein
LLNLKFLLPFFKAFLFTTPIVGNKLSLIDEKTIILIVILNNNTVILIDSTVSVPSHGIALIKLVIQKLT